MRGYVEDHAHLYMGGAVVYMTWTLATAADYMQAGSWKDAECLVLLGLAAAEQTSLDEGRWNIAYLFLQLPEPPWSKMRRKANKDMLRPFTRLLPPAWAAAASAYVKDMAALTELKKKGRGGGNDKEEQG